MFFDSRSLFLTIIGVGLGCEVSSIISKEQFEGCLLGLMVGDAVGAPFEGLPADFVFWHAGEVRDILERPIEGPLLCTDDTHMMIGVSETLLAHGEIHPQTLLDRFVKHYDPERGYGRGARQLLEAAKKGKDCERLAETLFPGGSFGNGAAMRVAPVGLLFAHNHAKLTEQAIASAKPTHRHPLGIEGARLLALAVALATNGPPLDRKVFYRTLRRDCVEEEFLWQLRAAQRLRPQHTFGFLGNSLPAHRSVVTSIACFTASPNSYQDCVERAIRLGDDTDTLAAMTGALCGAHLGVDAIPKRWLDQIEKGPLGVDYVRKLANDLWELHRDLRG